MTALSPKKQSLAPYTLAPRPAAKAIVSLRGALLALGVSLVYHLALLVIYAQNVPSAAIEFIFFLFADVLVFAVGLVPVVALLRGRLKWYDPLLWLSSITFLSSLTFYYVYLNDPAFTLSLTYRGSTLLSYRTEYEWLVYWGQAQLIVAIFLIALLWTNARPLELLSGFEPRRVEYMAAFALGLICIPLGMYGFSRQWTGLSANEVFLESVGYLFYDTSSVDVRSVTLQSVALAGAPLGLVGFIGLLRKSGRRPSFWVGSLVLATITILMIPRIVVGSRIAILFSVIFILALLRHFHYRVPRRLFIGGFVVVALLLGFISLIRLNPFRGGSGEFTEYALSGDLLATFLERQESDMRVLMQVDRVTIIGFMLANLDNGEPYVYGQSLLAGPVNFGWFLLNRVLRPLGLEQTAQQVWWESFDYVNAWRYGSPTLPSGIGSNPPSYPGEFFLQGGYPALILCSVLFGLFIAWLRRSIATGKTLLARWFVLFIAFQISFYAPALLSTSIRVLYVPILPVVALYLFLLLVFSINDRNRL